MAESTESMLIAAVRAGEESAWQQVITLHEGRLRAFLRSRVDDVNTADDLVQETFVGLLTSLPNYNASTPLEAFLFAIASHKLIDHYRKIGRRPEIPLPSGSGSSARELTGARRRVSSLVRSREGHRSEADSLSDALQQFIAECRSAGAWQRVTCLELLWVRGWPNKRVAAEMGISEQDVANHKSFAIRKLTSMLTPSQAQLFFPQD